MVAILAHHRIDLGLPAIGEDQGVVVVVLRHRPHVEGLVHHEHAEAVTGAEHGPAHGVVGAANGVEAGSLQDLDPTFLRPLDGGRAEHAVVVVDAGAPKLHRLTIDPQTVTSVE